MATTGGSAAYGAPPAQAAAAPSDGLASYGTAPGRQSGVQPYGVQPASPYGAAPASPYGAQPANPYGAAPVQSPYGVQRPQTMYTPPPAANRDSSDFGGIGIAILFGLIGGAIGTALWVGFILATHFASGYVGIGVGVIVGLLVKKGMGGPSNAGGIMASVITVLSNIAGYSIALAILQATASPVSFLFFIAGIFASYRVASN
jgi:hypothetical protein